MEFSYLCNGLICNVLIQDSVTRKRLSTETYRTILKCAINGKPAKGFSILLSDKNVKNRKYNIDTLIGIYTEQADNGIFALGFQNPKHDIMLITDNSGIGKLFVKTLLRDVKRFNIQLSLDLKYNPGVNNYLGLKRFDRNALDLGNLNVLILEKCFLPPWTNCIGNLPISYLSLTHSTLGSNKDEQDVFWDWMCMDTVGQTLKILEMNKCGLKSVPFEILYLKNLHTLSLAENQLTCIPYFIGELKNLDSLFINNNSIACLPICLNEKGFKDLNYFNNEFDESEKLVPNMEIQNLVSKDEIRFLRRKGTQPHYSLYYLSLFTMINNGIKIRRSSLPPCLYKKLKDYGENLVRCYHCSKLLIPEYSYSCFDHKLIYTRNLITNSALKWLQFECVYKCTFGSDIIYNLY